MAAHLGVKNSREAADWPGRYRLKTCEKEEPAAPGKASGVLRSDYCFFTDKSGEMRGI